ncbi:MAG: HD domain-containing protein [Chloroflexota bacterium]|nr:HD domain-containing protein [Chloroflexota bacterium]
MQTPTRDEAETLLEEAALLNPGPWVEHSKHVARAAEAIATPHPLLDLEAAFVLGLLHDIGRREGVTGMRHLLDGYNFLANLGYQDAANVCLTHPFPNRDIRTFFGVWDCSRDELTFVDRFLCEAVFDNYDRLIQLCDALAMASGVCLMEKRMMDVALRHGINDHTVAKWKATFEIKAQTETVIGRSVYSLFPEVVENTFGLASDAAPVAIDRAPKTFSAS